MKVSRTFQRAGERRAGGVETASVHVCALERGLPGGIKPRCMCDFKANGTEKPD